MVKMSLFFIIYKLTTDSSLAYGGFYQLANMFDFKYQFSSTKTDALCRPSSSSTKQQTNNSSVPNRFLSVRMYRMIAFCLICQNSFSSHW